MIKHYLQRYFQLNSRRKIRLALPMGSVRERLKLNIPAESSSFCKLLKLFEFLLKKIHLSTHERKGLETAALNTGKKNVSE